MSTAVFTGTIPDAPPQLKARLAGFFWLMTFAGGIFAMVARSKVVVSNDAAAVAANILANETLFRSASTANIIATCCYLAATLLVYELLRPVNRTVSLLAALFSFLGCAIGALSSVLDLAPFVILGGGHYTSAFAVDQSQALMLMFLRLAAQANNIGLVFFGLHCLLTGYVIFRSGFLPRTIGALLMFAGIGWLTFLWPPLANGLFPYTMLPGFVGEMSLTLWLLVKGVNERAEYQLS
jgi:hypothetical protein